MQSSIHPSSPLAQLHPAGGSGNEAFSWAVAGRSPGVTLSSGLVANPVLPFFPARISKMAAVALSSNPVSMASMISYGRRAAPICLSSTTASPRCRPQLPSAALTITEGASVEMRAKWSTPSDKPGPVFPHGRVCEGVFWVKGVRFRCGDSGSKRCRRDGGSPPDDRHRFGDSGLHLPKTDFPWHKEGFNGSGGRQIPRR